MYKQKLVLADDEPVTLEALRTVIEAGCPQVEIVGVFRNGRDVIEYIRNNAVDIVVTDIRMPFVDGLEILKFVYEHYSNIKVMIITGFKDFEYAHKAIRYRVNGLLTKPLDYEELTDKIQDLCRQNEQDMRKTLGDTQALLVNRSRMRQDLLLYYERTFPYAALCERYPEFARTELMCYVVELQADGPVPAAAWQDICEINNEVLDSFCLLKSEHAATLLLLTGVRNGTQAKMHMTLYLDDVKGIIEKAYGVAVMMRIRPGFPLQKLSATEEAEGPDAGASEACLQYVMGTEQREQAVSALHGIGAGLQKQAAAQMLQTLREIFGVPVAPLQQQLERLDSTRDLTLLLEQTKRFVQTQKNFELLQIKNYMYRHCDQELNLETVAKTFGMNYSYFSRMFKEKSGENVSQYITKIRIDRAKKLLFAGKSLETAAGMVGYDAAYLVKKFKKATGMTPHQYLEKEHAKQNT